MSLSFIDCDSAHLNRQGERPRIRSNSLSIKSLLASKFFKGADHFHCT
jgi:hypothetical protein